MYDSFFLSEALLRRDPLGGSVMERQPISSPPDFRIVLAAFVMDMLPRILVTVIATLVLGWIFRWLVSPPTIIVWLIIITVVTSFALARVCAALLIVAGVKLLGSSDPTNPEAMAVAASMASPRYSRFYLVRLGIALAIGIGLGLLMLLLDFLSSTTHRAPLTSFLTGVMTGVLYIYLSSGWELARHAVAASPRRG